MTITEFITDRLDTLTQQAQATNDWQYTGTLPRVDGQDFMDAIRAADQHRAECIIRRAFGDVYAQGRAAGIADAAAELTQ